MKKIKSTDKPRLNTLSGISSLNQIDQSTPILKDQKKAIQQIKSTQAELILSKYQSKNLHLFRLILLGSQKKSTKSHRT